MEAVLPTLLLWDIGNEAVTLFKRFEDCIAAAVD